MHLWILGDVGVCPDYMESSLSKRNITELNITQSDLTCRKD